MCYLINIQCCFVTLFPSNTEIKESDYQVKQKPNHTDTNKAKQTNHQKTHNNKTTFALCCSIPFGFQALPSNRARETTAQAQQPIKVSHKSPFASRAWVPVPPRPHSSGGAVPVCSVGQGAHQGAPGASATEHRACDSDSAARLHKTVRGHCDREKHEVTPDVGSHGLCQRGLGGPGQPWWGSQLRGQHWRIS